MIVDSPLGIGCAYGSWALLGRPTAESGTLCHGDGGHEGGDRRRRVLMLTILYGRIA
jgi:hypothetical protein